MVVTAPRDHGTEYLKAVCDFRFGLEAFHEKLPLPARRTSLLQEETEYRPDVMVHSARLSQADVLSVAHAFLLRSVARLIH